MELNDVINDLRRKGYSNATATYYGKKMFNEQYGINRNKYTDEEKVWAYSHGFTAEEVKCLKLDESNYKKYLPGGVYHLLDPIDPLTKRLVDGKLVIPYTIGGRFPQYLPKYYGWIADENSIFPMNDNTISHWNSVEDYLRQLLNKERTLAIKPYTGAGGIGFIKLEKIGDSIFCNGENCSLKEVIKQISDKYLITEYIHQCKEFDEVWKDSTATLRVITINKNGHSNSFVSYVRFGTKISKGACNLTSGGVAVPFDWETGKYLKGFFRYLDYCDEEQCVFDEHPDSHISYVDKFVPHFDQAKKLVDDICSFLTIHTYFGFDIIITDNGCKICEINSHPSLDYEQLMFGGIWEQSKEVQTFFNDLIKNSRIQNIYKPI